MEHGNLTIDPRTWLHEQFTNESCAECDGDAEHHEAVPFVGNWFAKCLYPSQEEDDSPHPVIVAFRTKEDPEYDGT